MTFATARPIQLDHQPTEAELINLFEASVTATGATLEAYSAPPVLGVVDSHPEPSVELEDDDELEDDIELEDEEPNPFESLRSAWQVSSGLAEWSRRVLDRALEVRLRVALDSYAELETSVDKLLDELARQPHVGRA